MISRQSMLFGVVFIASCVHSNGQQPVIRKLLSDSGGSFELEFGAKENQPMISDYEMENEVERRLQDARTIHQLLVDQKKLLRMQQSLLQQALMMEHQGNGMLRMKELDPLITKVEEIVFEIDGKVAIDALNGEIRPNVQAAAKDEEMLSCKSVVGTSSKTTSSSSRRRENCNVQ